jgi:hypothetical protein
VSDPTQGARNVVLDTCPESLRLSPAAKFKKTWKHATAALRRRAPQAGEALVLFPVITAASLVLMVLGAIGPLSSLFAHVSTDYGEGWNGYWTAAAMRSPAALYSKSHILIANNYPPLSFYVSGLVGRLTGDYIVAGRIVALTSLLSVAGLTGYIVFRLGRSVIWSFVSGLLILLYATYPLGQFFAVDNPQWLGQAIMLAGVLPLIGSEGKLPGVRSCLLSAACIVIGVLVKHNQFALPIAIASWLLVRDRKAAAIWCLAVSGLAVTAGIALEMIYGSAILSELFGFSRTYQLRYFLKGLSRLSCLIPIAVIGAISVRRRTADPRWLLFAIYAGLGLVLGALQHFGAGVGDNADYDALIGGTILCGAFLGSAATTRIDYVQGPRYRVAILGLLLVPILIVAPNSLMESLTELRNAAVVETEWSAMIADVRQARGPVLCEVLAICFWADKPMELDFFAYGQKLRTGADSSGLRNFITDKTAALLILDRHYDQHSGETRLTQPLPLLMRENYKLVPGGSTDIEELRPR